MNPETIDPYFFSVAETCQQIEDGRMSYIGDIQDDIKILLNRKGNHDHLFSSLPLRQELPDNLASLNYEQMTPVQA